MAKILLIEDEPDQSKIIKLRLESRGYQVITAYKAEEGMKLALEEKPDLILMDMILPGMHGLEATIELKRMPETKEIPIIALTAMSMPDFQHACYQDGVCAFIKKPYEPEDLFDEIGKNLNKKPKEFVETESLEKEPGGISSHTDIENQEMNREIVKNEEKQREAKSSEERMGDTKERGKTTEIPKKILIVDDDPDLIKMIGMRLLTWGYEVVVASDAFSATKRAHQVKPDLVLLDMMLPGGGGEGVFENLRKSMNTMLIPVILISAKYFQTGLEEKAKQMGAEGAIAKPFEAEELIAKVKKVLGD